MEDETKIDVYLAKSGTEIVRTLKSKEIQPAQKVDVFAHGRERMFCNFGSKFFRGNLSYLVDGAEDKHSVAFYLQYFNGKTSLGEQAVEPELLALKAATYDVFKASGITPEQHTLGDLGKIEVLLLSSVGDMTLERKLAGLPIKERERLNRIAGELLMQFHSYAQKSLATIVQNPPLLKAIERRGAIPHVEKAAGYYRELKGNGNSEPTEEETRFTRSYAPIAAIYDSMKSSLIHGDAGAQNFIGEKSKETWEKADVKIIDLTNLRFGEVMFDLAKLATSHNMLLGIDEWNSTVEYYAKLRANQVLNVHGAFAKTDLQPEAAKEMFTAFYAGIVHESLKRMGLTAKVKRTCPEKYRLLVAERPALNYTGEEMGRNMGLALDYILFSQSRFLWNPEQLKALSVLKERLISEGIIPKKEATKDLEAKCKAVYSEPAAK